MVLECPLNCSDHLPVSFCLLVSALHTCNTTCGNNPKHIVRDYRWDKGCRDGYYFETGSLLNKISHSFNLCDESDNNCNDPNHLLDIDIYYNEIVSTLRVCADMYIPKVPISAMKHYCSVALDDLKRASIESFNMWVSSGKPRQGPIFDVMKDAKYRYKLAVRDAVRFYENRFSDELYDHMLAKDMSKFWKVWSAKTCKNITSVKCVDGKMNNDDIANVFREKFSSVSSPCHDHSNIFAPTSVAGTFKACKLSVEEVDSVIFQHMKHGKAAGYDNLSLEHLIFCHPSLVYHLCRLFNLCLKHSYVPSEFGRGIVIPLVKDKHGDLASSDNYRGITVSPVISKVFEMCLLNRFGSFFVSNDLQLGFKKNLGCGPGVFLLQNITNYFVCRKSPVYMVSLDASKAFDRINHDKLFAKLTDRGAPQCFIGVLFSWYSKLTSCVRWNGVFSNEFRVTCGVHQGGILLPFLFNIYVDELLYMLSSSGFGCHIGSTFFGCIMYADNPILLSPSPVSYTHLTLPTKRIV